MSYEMEPREFINEDGERELKFFQPDHLPSIFGLSGHEHLTPEELEALGKTRLAAVKSLFFRFRDQTTNYMDTYEVSHLIGLLSFSDKFELHVARPTANFQQFEEMLEAMHRQQLNGTLHHQAACRLVADTFAEVAADLGAAEIVLTDAEIDGAAANAARHGADSRTLAFVDHLSEALKETS